MLIFLFCYVFLTVGIVAGVLIVVVRRDSACEATAHAVNSEAAPVATPGTEDTFVPDGEAGDRAGTMEGRYSLTTQAA